MPVNRDLGKLIAGATPGIPVKSGGPMRLTRGVVVTLNANGTVTITIDGGITTDPNELIAADNLNHTPLQVGDAVEVLVAPPRVVILGRIDSYPSTWTGITFANGWGNFGGGWEPGQYRVIGKQVFLRGLISNASGTALGSPGLPISIVLPASSQGTCIYSVVTNVDTATRMDFDNAGYFGLGRLYSNGLASSAAAFLSLGSVSYFVD